MTVVADRLLRDRGWVGQHTVALLGAENISLAQMAETLTEVLGTPIRYERGSRDESKRTLVGYGFSDAVAQAMIDMNAATSGNGGVDPDEAAKKWITDNGFDRPIG